MILDENEQSNRTNEQPETPWAQIVRKSTDGPRATPGLATRMFGVALETPVVQRAGASEAPTPLPATPLAAEQPAPPPPPAAAGEPDSFGLPADSSFALPAIRTAADDLREGGRMSRRTASRGKAELPAEPIPPAVVFSPPTALPPRPLPLRATAAAAAAAGGGEVPLSAAAEEALAAAAGGASVNEGSQPAPPPETPACAVARRLSSPPSVSKRQAAQRSPPQARLDPPVAHPLTGIALLDSLSQQANRALEPSQKKARNRLRYPEPPNARSGAAAAAAGCPPAALPSSRRVAREGQQPRRRAGQQQLPPPPPPASVQLHFAAHPFPPLRQEAVRLLDTALFAAVRGELTTQEASTHATVPSQCAIPLH